MTTLFENFLEGVIDDNPLGSGTTTINSSSFANLPVVAAPDIMYLVLDPLSSAGAPEVVTVTAHTTSATSVTVTRETQGTTTRSHAQNIPWLAAVTKADLDSFEAFLADGAVDSVNIANGAIDLVHMSADSVDSDQYVDGSIDVVHLATAVTDRLLSATPTVESFVPNFTGATTDPDVGSTGTIECIYTQIDRRVWGEVAILFSGTGISAGSGIWYVQLPVDHYSGALYRYSGSPGNGTLVGHWAYRDSSGSTYTDGTCQLTGAAHRRVQLCWPGTNSVTHSTPYTPADGDSIVLNFSYVTD